MATTFLLLVFMRVLFEEGYYILRVAFIFLETHWHQQQVDKVYMYKWYSDDC